ncbi:NUDIX domain-containing protein [Candidatus Woesearchaeota archaeon]|nr:NUDIX domain-containing protein [Candidatus Woesearchaeota archaeon]
MADLERRVRCVLHGSFRKNFDLIKDVYDTFTNAGIEVIAPSVSEIVGETDGFVHLANDQSKDPRVAELLYLKKLSELGPEGFSYYINPNGRLGVSASYELAIDQLTNTRCILMEKLADHPAYIHGNSVWKPKELASYVLENGHYPPPVILPNEAYIHNMLQDFILHGSIIAVGSMVVDYSSKKYKKGQEREILLVKTHKWGDRFSIVGGKVKRNERLAEALKREVSEETGLDCKIEESICTFDEIKSSGYFQQGMHRVFTDNVVKVAKRKVVLNEEAEQHIWIPPTAALKELDIEPNAKITLQLYIDKHKRLA